MLILVFKTNLSDVHRIRDVQTYLDAHPNIIQWNADSKMKIIYAGL